MSKSNMSIGKRRNKLTEDDIPRLESELRQMVIDNCKPLEDEPNYNTSDAIISRFLQARKYVVRDAFKQLFGAIEWRRQYRPLYADCTWCTNTPGYHGIRQIGFDQMGRPVFYACFAQCQTLKNTADDIVAHTVHLVENAVRCNEPGNRSWIFILDCTGLTIGCCNPRLAKVFGTIFGGNYPEHLYRFYIINQGPFLRGIWRAAKPFIDPNTAKKVCMLKEEQIQAQMKEDFSPEIFEWIIEETQLNRTNISQGQLRFWLPPEKPEMHDPRGVATYLNKYIEPLIRFKVESPNGVNRSTVDLMTHLPHPNILEAINGTVKHIPLIDAKSRKDPVQADLKHYDIDPSTANSDFENDSSNRSSKK